METTTFMTFIFASVLIILVPGPNVLVIMAISINYGVRRGLQTVAGTSTAMVIQLVVAACATGWIVENIATGLAWLRWFGVMYLAYLAVRYFKRSHQPDDVDADISLGTSFSRGFIVSLTNPKTILFFSAFLPQFVASQESYFEDITILSLSFLLLAVMLDSMYALLGGRLMPQLKLLKTNKYRYGACGVIYSATALWLALLKRNG